MKLLMANFTLLLLLSICLTAFSQNTNQAPPANQPPPIPLWPEGAPGAKGSAPEDIPSIQLYQPPGKASGAAIVICPGGGYRALAPHEGHDVAVWLNSIGVTAIVLKYRLGPKYQHPAMMLDALRAIRYTRSKAAEWKIDSNRVGIMGFSAGGHLASTAATHFDGGDPNASDPVEKMSSRPDLLILCYPVVTMTDTFAHKGSRRNLMGEYPTQQLIDLMSNEKQVTERTPPTFFFHTEDDAGVPVENSLMFAAALRQKKVPYELHVYEHGRHGVGLAPTDPALGTWPKLLENWLRARGFVNQPPRVSESTSAINRNAEIASLIDELRVAPPEFAASSMIKISGHPEIDNVWKVEILEEAFRIAFHAYHSYKMKYLGKFHVDTRTGYKSMAFDLKMDRLSLQLLAIRNMIGLDPAKARSLWGEMRKPKLTPLRCDETLVYDVSDYYDAMVEMARKAFTREDRKTGEPVRFVDSHIVNITSPAEVIPAALAIKEIELTPIQFNMLVETFSRALENVAKDDRSFWFDSEELTNFVISLAREWVPPEFLLSRFRDYLVNQLSAPRCADNLISDGKPARPPRFVTDFNRASALFEYIPKITGDDIRPKKIDGGARFHSYWETPRAEKLFQKIKVLRFGPPDKMAKSRQKSDKPPTPLPLEFRRSSEWQYQLSDFLREMAEWKPEHENSEADYFHQKCNLFNGLIELSPNDGMRMRMIAEYMTFLERSRFERESFIEWYLHVTDLLRRVRTMEKEEKELLLGALRDSNDHVLQLCVKLMPVFEAVSQAAR